MRGPLGKLMRLLLVAGLLAATSGEAFGYQRECAHHGAVAGHEAGTEAAHHGADAGSSEHDEDGHAAPCSCVGLCTVATTVAAPRTPTLETVLPQPAAVPAIVPAPVVPVVQVRISHLIPFSNAPPLV